MSKNPFLNALTAFGYILLIVTMMNWGSRLADKPDSFMAPVVFISLFTLSAAVMAYLFCFEPIKLYVEGKKEAAVKLFLQTVGVFGGLTFLLLILLFSGIIS